MYVERQKMNLHLIGGLKESETMFLIVKSKKVSII